MKPSSLALKCLRAVTPPLLTSVARRIFLPPASSTFQGPYRSWQEAVAASDGWDSDEIIDKVYQSMCAVRDGKAVFEQDSLLYDRIDYSPTILMFLMLSVSLDKIALDIVDFGGSLASNYYQCRRIVEALSRTGIRISWNIVEQPKFVELGRKHFSNEHLSFHVSLEDCLATRPQRPIMFTGSFQCLAEPLKILDQLFSANVPLIAFDRLIVGPSAEHAIYVQVPPPHIYTRTFPTWMFSKDRLIEYFDARNYNLAEYLPDHPDQPFDHCGMVFVKGT